MHEYYKKKSPKFQKTMKSFLALVGTEIEGAAGKAYDAAFEEMWNIYRSDMLWRLSYADM